MKYFILIISVLFFLLIEGCATSQSFDTDILNEKKSVQKEKEESVKEQKLPLSVYEATLNPADYDDEVDFGQRIQVEQKKEQIQIDIQKDSLVVREEIIQGFRIQVFSSSNVDDANLMKTIVSEKFLTDSVYMVYDPPVYKIRVGDFINRYEANKRLPEIIEKGYRDAWIVPDRVIQRKLVRIPIQN